jgi:outer membrane protein
MKNATIIWNILLTIVVAVLLFFQFGKKDGSQSAGAKPIGEAGPFRIAYFEMDSIENKFEYFTGVREELEKLERSKVAELNGLKNAYISKMKGYQEKGQTMTEQEVAKAQQELAQLERTYQGKEQMVNQELQDERFKKLQDVRKKIEDYLKEYNKDKSYSYIMSSASEIMFYKDSAYDITEEILQGLNSLYKKKQ